MKVFLALLKVTLIDFRYFVAIGIRLFMVILSEILYYKYNFVYTDIDYHVFSDGSKHMLNFESPYNRETYRYTPLLALIMIPNHVINYNFGKVLLSVIDVLVGLAIEILLNLQGKNKNKIMESSSTIGNEDESEGKVVYRKKTEEAKDKDKETNKILTSTSKTFCILKDLYCYVDNPYAYYSLLYLYNPITINICTRGSADCIITLLVIMTLIFIELGWFPIAGIVYGFAVHFKIYPIIYAPALYLYLISKDVSITKILSENTKDTTESTEKIEQANTSGLFNTISSYYSLFKWLLNKSSTKLKQILRIIFKSVFHYKAIIFAVLSVLTFGFFFVFFYIFYGNKFVYEYFLYHLVRKDHRHNYSIFYYLIYLTYNSSLSKLLSLITFVPQILLIIISTLFLFQNINLCLLILTMIFVTYNKVITAQYFLWYISIIPLIAPNNKLFDYKAHGGKVIYGIILFFVWLFFELIWNGYSHNLEYKGQNLFMSIWGVNMAFFFVNCLIIKEILVNQK